MKTELVADLLDVVLSGALCDEEPLRDLTVRQAVREKARHLSFASGELRRRRLHGVTHILLLPQTLSPFPGRIVGRAANVILSIPPAALRRYRGAPKRANEEDGVRYMLTFYAVEGE